jgi:hypothetical protein
VGIYANMSVGLSLASFSRRCIRTEMTMTHSWLLPLCQRSQFIKNFLQSLEPPLMIRCCGGTLFASV